jgi:hypothetical protein
MTEKKYVLREEWQRDAMRAVPDALVADIVSDARRGISQSASLIPDKQRAAEEPRAASGGTIPVQSPPGVRWIDQQVEVQNRIDHAAAIRQRVEAEWIEAHFQKGSRVKTDYDPFSPDRMKP